MFRCFITVVIYFLITCSSSFFIYAKADTDVQLMVDNGSYVITSATHKIRLTPYGNAMIRLQSARITEDFFSDKHYEMVVSHQWPRKMTVTEHLSYWLFSLQDSTNIHNEATSQAIGQSRVTVRINKDTLVATFTQNEQVVLTQSRPTQWNDNKIITSFIYDRGEHFTGLGHGFLGREERVDLKGQEISRNYGTQQSEQAPLIVPFYLSSKGYGVFLNSTFSNRFNFGKEAKYQVEIDDSGFNGQMDYFFIAGPSLIKVLDNYTQLTGRPRLPKKAMFGLQLSDKGHDHNSPTPSDENWWKSKILKHRQAGFPLDHVINDNRWRADGGKRCESKLAWDKKRYPNPQAYAKWLKKQGLVSTLDLNRCIAQYTDGWQETFNIPKTDGIDFKDSAPDLTNTDFRHWFWQAFYQNSLDPSLQFPGDALWIDEFDEMGAAQKNMRLANGKSWAEMRNYWFFLIAKALVEQGWDKSNIKERPFVWVRGMTAGAQRYATLWSGDIYPNHNDMAKQIRAMQLAGLSGFPYWGHDAGGFYDWDTNKGPDNSLYKQWAMAFGSFSPIWKPHGMGESRWPLDKNKVVQEIAHQYSKLRYQLMPYLYSAAHQAAATGIPIARAMLLDYPKEAKAWRYDLQYMWGDNLLIAPNADASNTKTIWLPEGAWYEYHSKKPIEGDQVIDVTAVPGVLPIYVKQGSIIPKRQYALSTQFIDKTSLIIDVYTGTSGKIVLVEDDDVTEEYRDNAAIMNTEIEYNETLSQLTIKKSLGNYQGAPSQRQYQINFFGLQSEDIRKQFGCVWLNEKASPLTFDAINLNIEAGNFVGTKAKISSPETMTLHTEKLPMNQDAIIKACQ
jgi:alpha-D-xyloside xylohydrolase